MKMSFAPGFTQWIESLTAEQRAGCSSHNFKNCLYVLSIMQPGKSLCFLRLGIWELRLLWTWASELRTVALATLSDPFNFLVCIWEQRFMKTSAETSWMTLKSLDISNIFHTHLYLGQAGKKHPGSSCNGGWPQLWCKWFIMKSSWRWWLDPWYLQSSLS